MKKILFYMLGLVILLTSCEEIAPVVTPLMGPPSDTIPDVDDQLRQVLIEEFTGVRCVQCPGGSAEVENLLAIHGNQLIAVQIHAGDFAPPFNESLYDFRTQEGEDIINYLGNPLTYPSAVVNRKLYTGENDLQLGKNSWAGYIDLEKNELPKVKLGMTIDYDENNHRVDVQVRALVQEDIMDADIRISLMLTESGIEDVQDSPQGKITDYEHKHVLRDMFTPYNGDIVPSPMLAGADELYEYSLDLDDNWNAEKCSVVAFISLAGEKLDVLQATEQKVLE